MSRLVCVSQKPDLNMTTRLNHSKTAVVAMVIVFMAVATIGVLPVHAAPTVWIVSLDANSINNTDACLGTSSSFPACMGTTGSFGKTFYIGAIVNASGTGGQCLALCLSGVYGWQFSIVYDNTSFVPQADPVASSANDLPSTTVRLGAQATPTNPNWDALKTGGA